MAVRAVVDEISQIGIESVEGTAVAANKRLLAVGFNVAEAAEFDEVQPMGTVVPTAAPMRQNWGTIEISDDSYPDYNSLLFLFSMLFGAPTTTTPGGATNARQHVWTPPVTGIGKQTATIVKGTPGGTAELSTGCMLTDLTLSFSRTSTQELSGSGFAGRPDYAASAYVNEVNTLTIDATGGTYTVTINGQTTAGVAYNANAATLQTALEALSNVAPGDVAVTGGPGATSPYTLTWGGALANTNVTITASGAGLTGGAQTAIVATTQQGGVADIAVAPILAGQVDVYMDSTGAGIGTTKLLTDFSAEWSISGLRGMVWVLNSALPSYKESVALRPDAGFSLELGNDATSRALVTAMRAGTTKFVEIRATGGEIESGQSYSLKIQMAGQINEAPSAGEVDGASTLPFGFRSIYDATWAKWLSITLVNSLSSTA
jgi:hypothetical protein